MKQKGNGYFRVLNEKRTENVDICVNFLFNAGRNCHLVFAIPVLKFKLTPLILKSSQSSTEIALKLAL